MLTINNRTDLFVILKAIELISHGCDITSMDFSTLKTTWWNSKSKSFQTKMTDNVAEAYFELSDKAMSSIPWLYNNKIKRNKDKLYETIESFPEGCDKTDVSLDMIKKTMSFLKKHTYFFHDIPRIEYDEDFIAELSALDTSYNPKAIPIDFVESMSRDNVRRFFNTLTAMAYCNHDKAKELMTNLSKAYENDFDFSILDKEFSQFQVVDNRMYIPIKPSWKKMCKDSSLSSDFLDDVYFVLSKNPYDFYYCSYGSEFQSCFALNSTHGGWVGAVINSMSPNCFMLYLTKKDSQKTSLTGECIKYPSPFMYARAWCWLSADGELMIDKIYSANRDYYERVFENTICRLPFLFKYNSSSKHLYKVEELKELRSKYYGFFYPDSLVDYTDDDILFRYDMGYKTFYGRYKKPDFKSELGTLTAVSPTLDLNKPIKFERGRLFNPKVCPITGLEIDESQDVSEYACKFKNKLERGLAVLTYIDGYVKVDAISTKLKNDVRHYYNLCGSSDNCSPVEAWLNKDFYSIEESLDKFKTSLKYDLNADDSLEFILLRVVNGGQITWVKLRKDK